MIPSIQIFDKTINAYIVLVILGLLTAVFVVYREAWT